MKRRRLYAIAGAMLLTFGLAMTLHAQDVRFQIGIGGRSSDFRVYFSNLSHEYEVPYGDICMMHDAGIVAEDIPTILYIHEHSPYSLRQIYSLRLNGATWANLSNWCGVPLRIEHERPMFRMGPPYGNAYGFYKNGHGHGRHWKDARYDDENRYRYRGDDDRRHEGRDRDR